MRPAKLILGLLALLLACPADDEGAETVAATSSPTTASTMATTAGSSTEAATTSSGPSTTGGSSGASADGSSSGGGTSPLDACLATCERLEECEIEEVPNCGIPCAGVPNQVAGCEGEYVEQQACAVALACDELSAWVDAMIVPGPHPCERQDDAYQACSTGATT